MTTLYERWWQVARERNGETALVEAAARRRWTFADLADLAERSAKPAEPILHPQGHSAEFVFAVLRAWRWGAVVCPLEPEQRPPHVPLPPAPCVHLKTTSATTGAARCIAFTAPQLIADADHIMATMGLRAEWPNLGAISLAHSYGFSNLVLPLLLYGIPLILLPNPLPEALRQAATQFPAMTLPAVPVLWRAWHEANAIRSNVRLAISAGSPLSGALERSVFASTGIKIHNFYGSSECGGIAYDRRDEPRPDDACAGSPLENVTVSLSADGCLCVHSHAVGACYWPKPDDTLGEGRFQATDLAELRSGQVFLRGRLGDQINVAGRKVLPERIEQVVLEYPAVDECLVFGVPSDTPERTDLIVACFVAHAAIAVADLRRFLLGRLPAWQVPREWRQVNSLKSNRRGKISRAEWRERFLQGEIGASDGRVAS